MSWDPAGVNWLGVVVAAGVGLLAGFIWLAPPIFGGRWENVTETQLPHIGTGLAPATVLLSIATVLVTAWALALLATAIGLHSAADGAILGFVAWLGFFLTATTNGVIFERRTGAYWLLSGGFGLVTLLPMGAVVGFFA